MTDDGAVATQIQNKAVAHDGHAAVSKVIYGLHLYMFILNMKHEVILMPRRIGIRVVVRRYAA